MTAQDKARAALGRQLSIRTPDAAGFILVRAEDLRALLDEPVPAEMGYWTCGRCGCEAEAHAEGGRKADCLWEPVWVTANDEPVPADEREALRAILDDDSCYEYNGVHVAFRPRLGADAVLAAGFRRQGPITDDAEWEYGVQATFDDTGETWDETGVLPSLYAATTRARLEQEREDADAEDMGEIGHVTYFVRRRRKAGPWEPVEAAEAKR